MKVLAYYGTRNARVEDRPVPVPGPNQLLVKINYCGICGSDMEIYRNPDKQKPPIVLGHENVGTVVSVGDGVTDYQVGDILLCGPPKHCAEDCPSCRAGRSNICLNGLPRTAGLRKYDGGYAEYMLVHDVAHTTLVKIAPGTNLKEAVLFDVVCVSFHAIRRSRFRMGETAVVSGTGSIGLSCIRLLKAAGASRIIALGTNSAKEDLIKSFGADKFINVRECEDIRGEICKYLGREVAADVAFECVGDNGSLRNCISAVKPGGQVMLIGVSGSPANEIIFNTIGNKEIDLCPSFVYTPDEVEMYLDMLATGKLYFGDLVTSVVSLDDCIEYGLDHKDRSQIKILIDPSL